MTDGLTESMEDYIEAIAELTVAEGHAHTRDIALKLNVKMPSVTSALRHLARMNYIVYSSHQPVLLTPAGQKIADRIIHRHTVLKKFFSEVLGIPLTLASETACKMEHIIDEETVRRFVIFSEAIENRSDARSLQIYLTEAMRNLSTGSSLCVLTALHPGDSAVLESFGRNIGNTERFKLIPGSALMLQSVSLDKGSFHVVSEDGRAFTLSRSDAENIWVKPVRL